MSNNGSTHDVNIHSVAGMYEDYFLDYASYVILERAIPTYQDGLKPVQRRILHSMFEKEDGRFHKVANIIGNTMQYHPHGDAAIGDALVKLGQKNLLIDTQGNWGDIRTGDSAAASRYIEARLSKFALEVLFNKDITEWQPSYDGRNQEPVQLPVKFPLLLCQGTEGIAVGLSTKILPHNFVELIKASIQELQGKRFTIYPDFETGGYIDISEYKSGKRGGKVRVRSRIKKTAKDKITITELPYGVTTSSMIDSIIKANDKGKIKIKRVIDNTAKDVEIEIELASGVSPDLTIDALYAFTSCEVSISPNTCVIVDNEPKFLTVNELLKLSTAHTKELLRQELEITLNQLNEKWHFASLEKIFIEHRVYREIEECESWKEVVETIDREMRKYIKTPSDKELPNDQRLFLLRDFTPEDVARLTEIRIKRISKYNEFKAEEQIKSLEKEIADTKNHLAHLTDYTIFFFEQLLEKYGKFHERKTEITSFDDIDLAEVAANNVKLYADLREGFIGFGVKSDDLITQCSDLDDVIAFKKDGTFQVVRIGEKVFVGKNIIYTNVWRKNDERTTYNMIYLDAKTGRAMVKRFQVNAITRDKNYDLTTGHTNNKVLYFTVHPNAETETVKVQLGASCKARIKTFEFDFAEIDIKGRNAKGNILTKYPVKSITQISIGQSSLGAIQFWMDEVSGRINTEERGRYLGEFDSEDYILAIYKNGNYIQYSAEPNAKIDVNQLLLAGKANEKTIISAVHYDGGKKWTMVKRFQVETSTFQQPFTFIGEEKQSKLLFATLTPGIQIEYSDRSGKSILDLDEFIDVKGWKAMGNKLSDHLIRQIKEVSESKNETKSDTKDLKVGDSIEFDVDENGQGKIF